jgi:hypothetical protein
MPFKKRSKYQFSCILHLHLKDDQMNKVILIGISLCFTLHLNAQALKEKEVPTAVTAQVAKLYPEASRISWEEEDGFYEASFKSNEKETSLVLSRDGVLVKTEMEIEKSALPGGVISYVSMHHPGSSTMKAFKITDMKGRVQYEVEADEIDYLFDAKGVFLSQEDDDDVDR